ncbi:hypothetical protein Vretifemale_5321 [Volvox reticuliferus]|uniref:starch synthase n=2 Tax=Volvox reticuliferus TaxID=1737510 RepID=A0A8J4FIA9_9CHLO|nr:hypothetical protein Vretifemale_5321 [Volvox reticuliferus]
MRLWPLVPRFQFPTGYNQHVPMQQPRPPSATRPGVRSLGGTSLTMPLPGQPGTVAAQRPRTSNPCPSGMSSDMWRGAGWRSHAAPPSGSRMAASGRIGAQAPGVTASASGAKAVSGGPVAKTSAASAAPPTVAPPAGAASSSGGGGAATATATKPISATDASSGGNSPPASPADVALPVTAGNGQVPGVAVRGPSSPVSFDKAMAAKINAARELARRLAEEKQAAKAALDKGPDVESKRAAELASAEAAAQAAKADALVRALRRAESNRDTLQRLRAENEALRELLLEVAVDKEAARARMEQVISSLSDQTLVERAKAAVSAGLAPAPMSAAELLSRPGPLAQPRPVDAGATKSSDAAAAASVEAQLVAASAQVAETISPTKAPAAEAAPPVAEDVQLVAEVRSVLQQKAPLETSEDTIKQVVKKAEQSGSAAAPEASAAATAVVEELHLVLEGPQAVPAAAPAPPVVAGPPAAAAPTPTAPPAVEVAPPVPAVREGPPPIPEPTSAQLQALGYKAITSNQLIFTWPEEGGLVGRPVRIYYNRTRGPLPPSKRLQVKAGFNKWEEIVEFDMELARELPPGGGHEWWVLSLELPSDLFRFDYVIVDGVSGSVDNNGYRDYQLRLVDAPTEDEVMAARAEAYRRFDEERRKSIEEEEKRLWRLVESKALDAAAAARVEFRRRRDSELLEAARQVVADRRKADITAVPAADKLAGVYTWCGGPPRPGQRSFLAYNKVHGNAGGGLMHAGGVRVHLGYDGWWNKITQTTDLAPLTQEQLTAHNLSSSGGLQWYGAWIDVPYSAAVLNFVFSDREQRNWDNNGMRDYHTLVSGAHSGDELVEMLHAAMKRDSADSDKEVEDRAALRAVRKVEAKGLTMRKRREVVHEFLYTVPLSPRAGQAVDVYYRPDATMLRGRPEIWLRATWNRLGAAACNAAGGALRPVVARLEPCLPGGLGFFKARVQVPAEAGGMDLSFSDADSTSGGFVDDNGGLDYHIPVEGSATPRRSLSIVHVAVEMAPIAKVGGMGDVVTALGRAVQEQGHEVSVIVPKYDCINYKLVDGLVQANSFNWGGTSVRVWRGYVEGLPTTFLEPENGMFWVGCIYGRNNDAQRFGFFCGAALQYLKNTGRQYDILHCHDWQSAPIAWGDLGAAKTVFTIHNLSYGADLIGRAMQSCNVATTVSPTYAREIAGHPSVASHLDKLYGVLNGIDQDIWDPSEDPCLPMHYSAENIAAGKEAARRLLRQRLNLAQADVPVVGCVTRLVAQKGIHLIKHAAWRTLERGGQFVLLGSAPDGRVQGEFNALREQLARAYPDRAALVFTYDEPLSHLIYAGSDMFLVPSMFEPCGLTQMIAMRYGTIPVVRKTGGLVDTVFDVDHDEDRARMQGMETNGFSFEGTDFAGMDYALNRALSCWYSDKSLWHSLRRRAMMQDWSWNSPALDYLELYYKALKS